MTYGSVFLLFFSRRQTKALNVAHELQTRWRWLLHTLEATLLLVVLLVLLMVMMLVMAMVVAAEELEFLFEPTPGLALGIGPGLLLCWSVRLCWLFGSCGPASEIVGKLLLLLLCCCQLLLLLFRCLFFYVNLLFLPDFDVDATAHKVTKRIRPQCHNNSNNIQYNCCCCNIRRNHKCQARFIVGTVFEVGSLSVQVSAPQTLPHTQSLPLIFSLSVSLSFPPRACDACALLGHFTYWL